MRVQRVEMPDGAQSWTVLDEQGDVIGPAERFFGVSIRGRPLAGHRAFLYARSR